MIKQIEPAQVLYVDTETTGLDPYTCQLLLLSLRADGVTYVVDFTKIHVRHLAELRKELSTKTCVLQNAPFDWKFIYHHSGIEMGNMYCTMVAEQLLKAGLRGVSASLQAITLRRLNQSLDKQVRESFIGKQDTSFSMEAYEYSARDVDVLEEIRRQQLEEISQQGLTDVLTLEMQLLPVTAYMEYIGISIDRSRLEHALPVFEKLERKADKALQDLAISNGFFKTIVFTRDGYTAINTASHDQMKALAQQFGITTETMNKKELIEWDNAWALGKKKKVDFFIDDTDNEEEIHIAYHHPFLRRHAIRTAVGKILGTYVKGLIDRINPVTQRIHTNFKQCGATATGRFSSVNPNLQNLPQSGKLKALGLQDHDIRSMFIPSPGRKFVIADFSGIEAVILAAWSQDENMLNQLAHGDIHSYVATNLFGVEVTKARASEKLEPDLSLRNAGKTLTYAIMYGTTGWNLYRTLANVLASVGITMTQDDGDYYIKRWHTLFPSAGRVLQQNSFKAITQYYVTTALGRRRRWEQQYLTAKGARNAAMREGSNAPIQGGSADMTKLALLKASQRLNRQRSVLLLCVHDEIVAEADDDYAEEAATIIKECMEEAGYELYPAAKPFLLIKADPKLSQCYDK